MDSPRRFSSDKDEHDQMQKKTFTKWVNYHLETHSSSELVEDLFEDLKDGVLLCHLIEVLTGEALPVNKTKESKRVHHISNLTTALIALRRRGLDLVNNNPADIANGNPRIICGLIWQMILHFQIENNVQLLKEWGFELESANSPSTSKIENGNSPFSKSPYQSQIGRLKVPVDRVVLRWVNAQLVRPYDINLTDMDKSWRDGIAFNALIHRIKPELIDMDVVYRNTPKTNLEQAFRLAKEHLHIRPLLDVEDMLRDKSDKRSVITYVSQFIRTLKHLRPIATCPVIDEHSLISWMEDTLNILRSSIAVPLYDQYQIYLSLRKQYFEHRNAYYSLREHASILPESEWNQIEANWKRIRDLLEDWSHRLEGELPGKLSELVQWLCTSEQIIQNPVDIRVNDAQLSLSNINESISHHKIHFSEFPYRSEQFQSIYLSRQVDEREVAVELLEPLKIRFNILASTTPCRLQYLYRIQAHYQLLSDADALNQKMERWKSSDSATAIQKSIKEYKMEADSAPAKKFRRLLTRIKEVYSETSSEESGCIMKQCEDTSLETVEKFQQLKPHLEELFKFWREFENTVAKIEERITRSEREKRNLVDGDGKELLRHCEKIHDDIAKFANDQVQQVISSRISELKRRINDINRKIPAKAVLFLQGNTLSEKRTKIILPSGENIAAPALDTQDFGHNLLQKWLIMARQQMSTVVTDSNTLKQAINQVANCLREVQGVENERMALLKTRAASSEQNIGEYRKLRSDLQILLQHMKNVQPLFLSFDENYSNLLNRLNNQDDERESEENKKLDMISHMTFLLETLSRNEHREWIDCNYLQHRLDELKHRMKERKEQVLQTTELCGIATGTAALTKKQKLLEQSLESLSDIKIWVDSIAEVDSQLEVICSAANNTSILVSDDFKNEKERLEKEWHQKTETISQLQTIHDTIGILQNKLAGNLSLSELVFLDAEIDSLSRQCMNIVDPSVIGLRNHYRKKIEEELCTIVTESLSRAERQISELSMADETDVRRAVDILQDYQQEAQKVLSDKPALSELLVTVKESQKILQAKMDLFTGLQHFYETLNAIKQENEQWNSITSQQIEGICTRLEELLKLVENECAPEANTLCSQFESIQSSFFQLECNRIKEKLRVLVLQLDKLVDLMAKRKILLLKCKEFQKFVKDAEDKLLKIMHEASIGIEIDMYRSTNEMSEAFNKLDKLGKELTACQLDANMTIADLSVVDALNRIKNIPLSVGSTEEPMGLSKRFQEFFDVSNQLESAFFTDIHTCEHLDDVIEFITVSLENGKKEAELMIQLVAISDDLTGHEKAKANDILSKLKRIMDKRQEVRRATVEDCMERSLVILTQKEDQLEAVIERDMNDQNLDAFKIDEVTKWIPWKEELDKARCQLFFAIMTVLIKNSSIQWRGSLDELVEKAANFDGRIGYFKNTIAKFKRREQRISTKLTAFTKWINLMEEDLNRAESLDNAVEREERLRSIYGMCLSHQALVDKFLSLKLDPLHSNEVKIQCDRYYTLLHRIGSRNFPEKQALSVHLSDLHSPSTLSQLSLNSLSASETDEDEMYHADHVEVASYEGTSSAYALIQRVLQAKETPEIRLLLSDIDSELNVLADSLSRLNADYARSLKPLSSAQTDVRKLKELNERRCQLDIACNDLLCKVSGDDLAVIRSLTLHLRSLEEPFMTFLRELQKEIDDEITLQANYEGIAKKLSQLSTDVDQRTRNTIQDVRNQLEYVQSDLNLLRAQCSQRRKYVENMIECVLPDATLSNCSRRKKIMLMVSRTVTTIIQVVEDELRRPSSIKENDLLELKQKLQEVNICIADETDAMNETVPYNIHEQESAKLKHEKEQLRMMQSELTKLEEKIPLANQLLAYDIDLKNADNPEDIGEKAKNIENLEQFLVSTLDKLKDCDRNIMTNEQRINMERMLNEIMPLIDKLRVLRYSITSHLKSLNDWKITEKELEDEIRIIMDNIEGLLRSYSQPQPYTTAINDIDILQRLQDQIMQLLQKTVDKEQTVQQNLPSYLPGINKIKQKIEKAAGDVKELLSSLTDDVATEKQLVDMQNDLINRLNKLSDRAIMVRSTPYDETQALRLEELKNEHGEISDTLEQLKEKECKPMKLVLHSDALRIPFVVDQYENLKRLLNETQEQLVNENAHITLQSTINKESDELRYMMDEAYKIESDVNVTTSDLQKAIDNLKNGRSHLEVIQDVYDKLEKIPDTDSLREKAIDEISTLNEQYDNVERNLEDRLDMLNKFDEIANNVNEQLMNLENNVCKLESPNANCELAIADKGFNDIRELRKLLEELDELKEQLIPLLRPVSTVEDFNNRLSDVNKNFQQWYDEIVKKKQELEAENNLSNLINDFEQAIVNAENDFEKLEVTTSEVKNFNDIVLPMIVEKSDRIRDLLLPVKTENIEQLYHNVDVLTDRYNDLSTRVNDKLNHAKEQENLLDDIQQQLDCMEQKVDDFLNKYIISQDLSIAMEDVNYLHSLLDQIPTLAMENITERGLKENLIKKADTVKMKIKNLLIPLEKDIQKEQELMHDMDEIISTLASISDDVIAIDSNIELSQQLENIAQLAEKLRKLREKIEKLEERLQGSEGMVKRALITDDLFGRVVELQNALDDKREKLTNRAKLYAIIPEINLINESVQNYINEMEQIPMKTVEEQNAALNELEGKKHQLENLLENIPPGDESNELRERNSWLLGQINNILKRLTGVVGEKLAALATFNAIKDEVETQLSLLQSIPTSISDENTVLELDSQLSDINDKFANLERLKNKIGDADERNLDVERITEKQNLLRTIEEALNHLKIDREIIEKRISDLCAAEKMHENCNHLCNELNVLIKEGEEVLNDAEAFPTIYTTTLDAFVSPLEMATEMLTKIPENEDVAIHLNETVMNAKIVQANLSHHANLWSQFIVERDNATDQLETKRKPLDEIGNKQIRSYEQVADDLDKLKKAAEELNDLRGLMTKLQSLSEQLDPLEAAYADVRFYDVDVEQTQQQYENLISSMNSELQDENILNESAQQLAGELEYLNGKLSIEPVIREQLEEMLNHQLPPLQAQLQFLQTKDDKAKQTRTHVDRVSQPAIETLTEQLNYIYLLVKQQLDNLAKAESQEKAMIMRMELEKLRSEPYDEEILMKLEEQLQQLHIEDENMQTLAVEVEKLRANKIERNAFEKEIEMKLAELLNRMNVIRTNLSSMMEEEESEKGKMRKDKQALPEIDEQINAFESALNETVDEILPSMNELISRSHLGNINLPSLQFELENMQKFVEKCKKKLDEKLAEKEQLRMMQSELTKLEEKIPLANQLLAYDIDLKNADNPEDIGEKAKNIENLEQFLVSTLDKLKDCDRNIMTNEQRINMERMLNEIMPLIDKLRVLRYSITSHLKSLNDWKITEKELEDEIRIIMDNIEGLLRSYSQPQPYTTAINDIDILQRLQDQIMQLLQKTVDKEQTVQQNLPSYLPGINKIKQKIEKAAGDVKELLSSLTDDVATEKQLVDMQNDLINRLNKLSDRAIMVRSTPYDETQALRLEELKNEHGEISDTLEQLKEKECKPMKLVLHSDALRIPFVVDQYENLKRLLNETQEQLVNENAHITLQSTINKESDELRYMMDEAYKIESDVNVTTSDLQKAIDNLKNGRSHLEVIQDVYDKLEKIPDTDSLREKAIDEISTLNEQYDNVERNLEDRLDMLNKFDEIANNVNEQLMNLENNVCKLESPNANCELAIADKGFNDIRELRKLLEELDELKEQLIPLLRPVSTVEDFNNRLSDVNKNFQQWYDEIVKKKQELEAENNLSNLINDFEQAIVNAENDFEKLEVTTSEVKNFNDIVLPMIVEKSDRIRDLLLPVKTENIEQLYHNVDVLTDRYNDLSTRVNDKLNHAKEQENLLDDIQQQLDCMEQKVDDFLNKYIISQDLSIAMEDVNYLHSLLDQIPTLAMENITERGLKENLIKKADTVKMKIKNLLIPLEKDIQKEQELMHDMDEIISTLASISDDVIAIDSNIELSQQLENIAQLAEKLRKLREKIEKLEERLQGSEGMVKRALITDDLFGRVVELQNALDDKREKLTNRAKLYAIIPEINLINESVQNYINEMEQIPMKTVEEQNAALNELEGKKHQLENLLENIPPGDESNELRERNSWLLGQINNILKRLTGVVGEKLAALATFNAIKDEVETQLSLLQSIPTSISDENTVLELDSQLSDINDKFANLERLKNKIGDADERNLDVERITEKQNLLRTIEEALNHLKIDREIIEKRISDLCAAEKMHENCNHLCNELNVLIKEGEEVLNDAEAFPTIYTTTLDAFVSPLEMATEMLTKIPENEDVAIHLNETVMNAKIVQANLSHHANLWSQFIVERDNATDQLETKRKPLDEIGNKQIRSYEQVADDLDKLKKAAEELNDLRGLMTKLQSLSEQLDPLEAAYADVRFYDVDVEQTQQQYENLISSMNSELQDENILNESAQQLAGELEYLNGKLSIEPVIREQLEEMLNHQLPPLQAQLQFLQTKDDKAKQTRTHVDRVSQPAIETLTEQLNYIYLLVKQQLDNLAKAESQEKAMIMRMELEKLRSEPYDEEILMKLEEQLQQLHIEDENMQTLAVEVEKLRANKIERNAFEKEIEMKLAELLNRMNVIRTNLSSMMEEEESEKGKMRKDKQALPEIDEQINAFESALNETVDEILPSMNELISRSHLGNINLPSLQFELENMQKFVEKCKKKLDEKLAEKEQLRMMQSELTKLEEKIPLANQLLAYDIDLKNADNPEDIGEKAKNIENLEQFLVSTLDKLKDCDRNIMTNEQRINMERMLNEIMPLIDKLRVLRYSITSHLKSLNDWKITEKELEDEIRIIMDNIEGLLRSYSQPQPYTTAINDIDILQRLQDQIMQLLQKTVDKEQTVQQNLPSYLPGINKIKQKIEKAAGDVKELLSSLTDDVATEKQLVDMQNDLINRLNKLSDRAIMVRSTPYDETQALRLEELKNEHGEISDTLEQLKEKECKPMKLVLHSDALRIPFVVDQYENLKRLLNETQEQLVNENAHITLQSTINKESDELRYMMDEAYKIESDVNVTTSDLQKAIDNLKNGRSHLEVIQDVYDKLEKIPDTDSLREKAIDEISTLNEQYDNVERNLEDRLDMLNKFDEIANNVNEQLMNLENNVCKLESPNANCELAIADKGFNDIRELRKLLEELDELKEQLIPLLRPVSTVEDFNNRLSDVNKNFQQWYDEIVKKKQELEAENNLSNLINDFEQAIVNAENDFEKLEVTTSEVKNFNDIVLPMIVEKSDRIRDLLLPVKTENIEQLYHNVDVLTDRYNDLSTRVNDKLNHAKEQENLLDDIQQQLDCMEQKVDDFLNKYIISQDLSIAMEDVNYLHSLLDQIPTLAMENITERGLKENLIKKADTVKMKIKNLLIPLEKDIQKEQELMHDMDEIISTLASISDDVIAIDSNIELSQQLENIAQLAEKLRKLREKIEKLEERLQGSEGMVKRALITDDLFGRVVELQNALDDKREKLTNRAKLYAIIPEINLINESVQNYINEMEQIPMKTVEEQNAALNELEGKKHQLENLLENIPPGDESNELRERNSWLLGQINNILKRLTGVVGEKLAALATFNAIKDEVETQLSLLQSIPTSISDENTVLELDSQLSDINDKFANLERLKNKIGDADERNLDVERITEKQNLLRTIEEALNHLKIDREIIEKRISDLCAAEKMHENCNHLCNELNVLIKEGEEVLNDAEAFPTIYTTTLDAFVSPLEMATEMLTKIPENEDVAIHLNETVMNAKIVQANLSHHANLWSQFIVERDNATDQLETKRKPLDEIGNKQIRSYEQVADDLDKLKKAAEELNDLRGLMTKLQSLSEQLDPLEAAYADVRFYDVDVEQTQQQYENLISSMNSELQDENILNESAQQLAGELEYLNGKLSIEPVIREQLEEMLNHQLPPLQAQLQFLQTKDDKAKQTRTHVDRVSQPAIETLTEQLNYIYLLVKQQLDNLAKAESQEKAMIMRMELEKLRSEPYDEEILMKLEEQLQQLHIEDENMQTLAVEVEKLRANKIERNAFEKEIEMKLAELLNRMNVIRTNLSSMMEEEESEKGKMRKDKQALPEIDEQINAFESALNETVDEILPSMNELISRSHLGNINLPSLQFELENMQKFVEKCKKKLDEKLAEKEQLRMMQSELTKLEEKIPLANQLLAYDIDLKNADNPEDIGEKAKNIENLEQFLVSTLDKLKDCDRNIMTNEQRINMERMLNEIMPLIDKLRVLRYSITSHLKSLNDWKITEKELEDEIRIIMDNIEGLLRSYSQPQPYTTAINDIDILQRLQDQIMQLLQKTVDKEQTVQQNLPSYLPGINKIKQKIEKAAGDVKELLSSLTDDVATEKQLVDMQNDLINRLNKLSDRAIMVRSTPYDETQALRLEELKNEHGEISDTLEQLKEKECKPMKLVLHSDALRIPFVVDQYENLKRLLNETQEQLVNENAHITLQSTINKESDELRYMMDEAYKIESDVNVTTSDLQKAIDNLKNGRSHLEVIQDVYDKLEKIPDTDSLREKAIDEISTLNEQYDNVERNLEDRLDMLNKFDEIANNVNEQLMNLENNVCKLESPNANCELAIADKGFNDIRELRKLLEELDELKEQLIPLLRPVSTVEDFNNRLSDVNKNFQQWYDEIVKKKQELEAENNLSNLINDFEQAIVNAENDFEKLEVTTSEVKNFNDIVLPMIVEKSDRIRDLLLPVKTENIEQLYHNVDVLTDRYNDLSTRVNDKLNHAKEQENLLDDIQQQLDCMEQKVDDFLNKYIISQDLSIAMEDVNYLHSLLDQIPTLAMENITERGLKENLIKKADTVKMKIKNLLIPLEKDIQKEQELMHDMDEIISTLASISDDVIAIDSNIELSQQLENIAQLAEKLRKLREKIEKLEERLQGSEGMVKRALITDDLFGRVVELQNALDDKREKLTNRAKLYAIIPEINLINESVQNYINEMEQIPMKTVEEQNAALNELEGKKHQLENLLENIPPGDESNELRERNSWLLGQINNILKRLTGAVGEKLAALATFNAIKDEVETQLSLLQSIPTSISDENTVLELDSQLSDINDKTEKLQRLREKVLHASVSELSNEQYDERNVLLSKIDGLLLYAQKNHEYFDEKRTQLLALETICTECKVLYSELENLIKDGQKWLDDSESLPVSYTVTSDALNTLIETAVNLRTNKPHIEQFPEPIFAQLWELIDKAKDVQTQLIHRIYVWEQFVKERDSAMVELNDIQKQIREIEGRGRRRIDKMLDDLEALKMLYLRWSFLANLPSRLLSLSSQLHPLACVQREGKAFAEEACELEKKIEDLLDSMSAEFRIREEIVHSLHVISDELVDIKNAFDDQNISTRLQKELQQQLDGIRAHLNILDEDITKYNNNRIFLDEEEDVATKHNFEKLKEIEEKLKLVEPTDTEEEYDIDAAAEVLAAVYPDDHPRDVLREQGIPYDDELYDLSPSSATSDDDDNNKFKTSSGDEILLQNDEEENVVEASTSSDIALSPIPDDPSPGHIHYERQRIRWRRILRTALPLQAMLVLLLGAACLVPHCDNESCCQLLNNFARSFDPSLEFLNGPPPF